MRFVLEPLQVRDLGIEKTSRREEIRSRLESTFSQSMKDVWSELQRKGKEKKAVLATFRYYWQMLAERGMLILDADGGKKRGFEEDSTYDMLTHYLGKDFFQDRELRQLFDSEFVGHDQQRVLVLRKKQVKK